MGGRREGTIANPFEKKLFLSEKEEFATYFWYLSFYKWYREEVK